MTIYLDSLDSYYSNMWLFDPSMTITEFDFLHEKNTNPEIDKIEREILPVLNNISLSSDTKDSIWTTSIQ